jgi:hypothetical protein
MNRTKAILVIVAFFVFGALMFGLGYGIRPKSDSPAMTRAKLNQPLVEALRRSIPLKNAQDLQWGNLLQPLEDVWRCQVVQTEMGQPFAGGDLSSFSGLILATPPDTEIPTRPSFALFVFRKGKLTNAMLGLNTVNYATFKDGKLVYDMETYGGEEGPMRAEEYTTDGRRPGLFANWYLPPTSMPSSVPTTWAVQTGLGRPFKTGLRDQVWGDWNGPSVRVVSLPDGKLLAVVVTGGRKHTIYKLIDNKLIEWAPGTD